VIHAGLSQLDKKVKKVFHTVSSQLLKKISACEQHLHLEPDNAHWWAERCKLQAKLRKRCINFHRRDLEFQPYSRTRFDQQSATFRTTNSARNQPRKAAKITKLKVQCAQGTVDAPVRPCRHVSGQCQPGQHEAPTGDSPFLPGVSAGQGTTQLEVHTPSCEQQIPAVKPRVSGSQGGSVRVGAPTHSDSKHAKPAATPSDSQPTTPEATGGRRDDKHFTSTSPAEISDEIKRFFSKLFAHRVSDPADARFFLDIMKKKWAQLPTLLSDTALLGKDITAEEASTAAKGSKTCSGCGLDGLPFWIFCSEKSLPQLLADCINASRDAGELPTALTDARGILLKKNDDDDGLDNYRLIQITASSYRIFAKIINKRLLKVLGSMIGKFQSGFIPGRLIASNILLTKEALFQAMETGGAVIGIDFRKAFDSLSRTFLTELIDSLPFPAGFKKFLKLAFSTSLTTVFINDVTWASFLVHSGVRQGCSLAPSLFTLAAECFIEALRECKLITGVNIPGHGESKGAAFADDTMIYVKEPQHVPNVVNLLRRLQNATGLAFHPGKSWVMGPQSFLNGLQEMYPTGLPFSWVPEGSARLYLGAFLHRVELKGDILTWDRRIRKFHAALRVWNLSGFGYKDRASIINSFCVSTLLYSATHSGLPMPAQLKALQVAVNSAVWGCSPSGHVIKQSAACSKNFGGINLSDIKGRLQSNQLHQVIRMVTSEEGSAWQGTLFRPLNALCLKWFGVGLLHNGDWMQMLGCLNAMPTSNFNVLRRERNGLRPIREALLLWVERMPFQDPEAAHHFILSKTTDPRMANRGALFFNLPERPTAMQCTRTKHEGSLDIHNNICFPSTLKLMATNDCKLSHAEGDISSAVPVSTISVSDLYWSHLKETLPSAASSWSDSLCAPDDGDYAVPSEMEVGMSFHHGAQCFILSTLHFTDFNRNLSLLHLNFGAVQGWRKSWLLRQTGAAEGISDLCHLFTRLEVSPPEMAVMFRSTECPMCHCDVGTARVTAVIHAFSKCTAWALPLWDWLSKVLRAQHEEGFELSRPQVIFLGENLSKARDYPTVFAMAVVKSALFNIVETAHEGMSTTKFSLAGIKQIIEAKVRQEGYIQWLSLMKHRVGHIGPNPLIHESNRAKFIQRWCKSHMPLINADDAEFIWNPWCL